MGKNIKKSHILRAFTTPGRLLLRLAQLVLADVVLADVPHVEVPIAAEAGELVRQLIRGVGQPAVEVALLGGRGTRGGCLR